MYSIFYDKNQSDVKGYRARGKKFRVDTYRFGERFAYSADTEVEAIAVLQHLGTLATAQEVKQFREDLRAGDVRVVEVNYEVTDVSEFGSASTSEPVSESVALSTSESQGVSTVAPAVTTDELYAKLSDCNETIIQLRSEVASLRQDVKERDEVIASLRSEIESLNAKISDLVSPQGEHQPYKTKFECLESVTGGVQKFSDMKSSFFKRLKFLFFPNKY